MTVYDSTPTDPSVNYSKLARFALYANVLTLGILWASHDSLATRLDDGLPQIERIQSRVQATESEVREVKSTIGRHSREMNALKFDEVRHTVGVIDLAKQSAQYIGKGFGVTRLRLEQLSTGFLIEGDMINMQSVKHSSPAFRITIGRQTEDFTMAEIDAGRSVPFAVFIPEVSMQAPRYARIDFVESTVWYRQGAAGE